MGAESAAHWEGSSTIKLVIIVIIVVIVVIVVMVIIAVIAIIVGIVVIAIIGLVGGGSCGVVLLAIIVVFDQQKHYQCYWSSL